MMQIRRVGLECLQPFRPLLERIGAAAKDRIFRILSKDMVGTSGFEPLTSTVSKMPQTFQ